MTIPAIRRNHPINEFSSMIFNGRVDSVLAVVANYGFSAQADRLKQSLKDRVETLLIDNSSPVPPLGVDLTLPNGYYTGLWNVAVKEAMQSGKEWLLFIASDVEISDVDAFVERTAQITRNRRVGLYTPALKRGSRLSYPVCFQADTDGLRECYVCEGFFFLIRTKIVAAIYPVNGVVNKYGWGIDAHAAYVTYLMGYRAVVDDRLVIYHPAAIHEIPLSDAKAQVKEYLPATVWQFLVWTELQILKNKSRDRFCNWLFIPLARLWWQVKEKRKVGQQRKRSIVAK